MWETGETWGGNSKKRLQESVGSVAAEPASLESNKEAGRGGWGVPLVASDQRFS